VRPALVLLCADTAPLSVRQASEGAMYPGALGGDGDEWTIVQSAGLKSTNVFSEVPRFDVPRCRLNHVATRNLLVSGSFHFPRTRALFLR
jgi:hypothetical protein